MVEVILDAEQSRRGGEVKGKHECTVKGVGGGLGVLLEGNQDGIRVHDFEVGRGGGSESCG